MRQNAAVLALLGAAKAMKSMDNRGRREDRDFDMPAFQGLTPAESCKDDDVNTKFQEVNSSETALEQLETNLTDVLLPDAATKRGLMEAAINEVMAADATFKATLLDDTNMETEVLRLQADAMAKQTLLTAALALKTSTTSTFDTNTSTLSTLLTEKGKAETAFTKQAAHLIYQNNLVDSTKLAYIGATGTEAVPIAGSAAKDDDAAITNYNKAVNALINTSTADSVLATVVDAGSPQGLWDAKVTEVAGLLVTKNAELRTKTDIDVLAAAVKVLLNVDAASTNTTNGTVNGYYKDRKDAADAITTWMANTDKYNDKAALWVTAATLAIDGWQANLDKTTPRTSYTQVGASWATCTGGSTPGTPLVCDTLPCTLSTCQGKCDAEAAWAGDITSGVPTTGCLAVEFNNDGTCTPHTHAFPSDTTDGTSAKKCYTRDQSKAMQLYWANGGTTSFSSTYLLDGTNGKKPKATAAWAAIFTALDTEWTTHLKLWEDKDRVVSTAVKLAALYDAQAALDNTAYNDANSAHSTADGNIAGLLTTANNWGMNDTSMTLGTQTGVKISALKTLKETAEKLTVDTAAAYAAAQVQQPLQVEMDAQAQTWKTDATNAYNALEGSRLTAVTGWETAKTAAVSAHTQAESDYNAAIALYQTEIGLSAVTDAASAAASGITAVTDARATADSKKDDLNTALGLITDKIAEIEAEQGTLATKKSEWKALVGDCEVTQYLAFREAFFAAKATREEKLDKIKDLMADNEKLAIPAANGKVDSRCERPRSNGDKRSRVPCSTDDGLCCGAATKTVDGALVTIETCQKADANKFSYQPKRGPMEITDPEQESWDFACIGGAQRVLAAATAAAGLALLMQ